VISLAAIKACPLLGIADIRSVRCACIIIYTKRISCAGIRLFTQKLLKQLILITQLLTVSIVLLLEHSFDVGYFAAKVSIHISGCPNLALCLTAILAYGGTHVPFKK